MSSTCDIKLHEIFQGGETLTTKQPDLTDKDNPWGSKYTESMCLEIIEMFSKGKTQSNFCAKHTIGKNTFERWRLRHPLFDLACVAAHEAARSYFDDLRNEHLINEIDLDTKSMTGVNHALFNRMYNTRFNIPDKRAVKVKGLGKSKNEKEMLKCLMRAIESGELTPDEAQKLASIIDVSLKVKSITEIEAMLKEIKESDATTDKDSGFIEVNE